MSSADATGAAGAMTIIDRIAHTNRWRGRSLAEKVLLALGLLAVALTFPPWPTAVATTAVAAAAAMVGARVPPRLWAGAMAAPLGFAVTGAATLLVGVGDGGVHLTADGPALAGALLLRTTAATAALLLLALTTPASDLLAGLARLRVPAEIVELALLVYRFLFVLAGTFAAMHAAQEARLGHVGWRRRIRSSGLLAANLLPRALDRAHRLEAGLAARGWDGGALRVATPRRPVSPTGLAAISATLTMLVALGVATR